MMTLLSLLLIVFLFSCKGQDQEYVNHNNWSVDNIYSPASLQNEPKEVKESWFTNITDTSFSDTLKGKLRSYSLYKFGKKGHIDFMQIFIDGGPITDTYIKFDENGEQYETLYYDNGDTTKRKRISKRQEDGRFKAEIYNDSMNTRTYHISFLEKGNKIVTEIRSNRDNSMSELTRWYKDHKLLRSVFKHTYGEQEYQYYYSVKGFIDSVVLITQDTKYTHRIYINNQQGDPVYFEDRGGPEGQELMERRWMKYVYDEKGNWIKQISKREGGKIYRSDMGNEKFPEYELTIREIKY